MSEESAPSAGASEPNPGSAPSPSASEPVAESRSIDQIWEGLPKDSPEDQIHTEEAPAEEVAKPAEEAEEAIEAKPDEEGKDPKEPTEEEQEAERPIVEPIEPPYLKSTLEVLKGHPKLAQAVKNQHYVNAAFREQFQTPGDARAYKEIVSSVEEAKELVEKRDILARFDYDLARNPQALVGNLLQGAPRETMNLLASLPQTLADLRDENGQPDHRAFRQLSSVFVKSTLANLIESNPEDETLKEAIDIIHERLGVKGKAGEDEKALLQSPKVQAIMRENEQHRTEAETQQKEKANSFAVNVDKSFRGSLAEEAGKYLAPLFKGQGFTQGAKDAILGEIITHIEEKMTPWATSNLNRLMSAGKLDDAHRDAVVRTYLSRATPILRSGETKAILVRWTKDILGANRREISKREAIAGRRDVGAGGHMGTGASSRTANKDVGEMSPAEKAEYFKGMKSASDIWGRLQGG